MWIWQAVGRFIMFVEYKFEFKKVKKLIKKENKFHSIKLQSV